MGFRFKSTDEDGIITSISKNGIRFSKTAKDGDLSLNIGTTIDGSTNARFTVDLGDGLSYVKDKTIISANSQNRTNKSLDEFFGTGSEYPPVQHNENVDYTPEPEYIGLTALTAIILLFVNPMIVMVARYASASILQFVLFTLIGVGLTISWVWFISNKSQKLLKKLKYQFAGTLLVSALIYFTILTILFV